MSVKNFNFDNSYNPTPVKIENFTPAPAPGLVFVQKSDSCSGNILDSRRSPLRHSGSVITSALCKLGLLILGYSIERLDRQKRKFAPIVVITEAKKAHFFVCTRSGFVY